MAPPSYQELINRLPWTFRPALNDQFRQWDLLFPAERRLLTAELDWLQSLPEDRFRKLLAPLQQLEQKMDLPKPQSAAAGMTIHDTGVLARSPLYPQWRGEVEKVFSQIDSAVESAGAAYRHPRLLLCILPAGVPISGQALWQDLAPKGRWVRLPEPFAAMESRLVSALCNRPAARGLEPEETNWVIEVEPRHSRAAAEGQATAFSWELLVLVRREFSRRLNAIRRDLKSADEITEELRRQDIRKLAGKDLGVSTKVLEFIRAVLLSGNGSLVFPNSFVQWSCSEALRRAQPQVMIAGFGMRAKLKPFSSLVLFEDQQRSNPARDEDDPAGSLVDGQMLSQYVYYSALRLAAYRGRTMAVFAARDLDRVLLLAPESEAGQSAAGDLTELTLRWLEGH